jgi:hypothetical protein
MVAGVEHAEAIAGERNGGEAEGPFDPCCCGSGAGIGDVGAVPVGVGEEADIGQRYLMSESEGVKEDVRGTALWSHLTSMVRRR